MLICVCRLPYFPALPLKHDRKQKGSADDMSSCSLKITANCSLKIVATYSAASMSESGGKGQLDNSKTVGKARSKREVADGGRDGLTGGDGSVCGMGMGVGRNTIVMIVHHRHWHQYGRDV